MANYLQTLLNPVSTGPDSPYGVKSSREYAAELLKGSQAPVAHWAQGLGNITKALMGGYTEYKAGEQEKEGQQRSMQALLAALGLNQNPQEATTPTAQPQQPITQPASPQFAPPPNMNPMFADTPIMSVSDAPAATPQQANLPRGLRNNNPGNIIDGPFAKNLPGYAGTDGKFAKFASLDDGNAAIDRLLQSYGNRGFNTPSAITNRWAPASDGNNPQAYAQNVARALGVDVNAPLDMNNPQTLSTLRSAITRQENGPVASLPQSQPVSAAPASAGVVPSSPAATPPINRQALAAIMMDPWASDATKAAVMQQLMPKDPEIVKLGKDDTAYSYNKRTGRMEMIAGNRNQANFEDTMKLRKEVADLPEVKRYSQAAPIFQSMINSAQKNTAASDLDFVYGIAKIFDPESVVREGEMKLAAGAQSIPQQLQGWMAQVVNGQGRLTPEQRQSLLEVSATRMKELRGALDTRINPYEGIITRNNMPRQDVLPGFNDLPEVPSLRKAEPSPNAPPIKVNTIQDAMKLPKGTRFLDPQGNERVVP